VVISLNVREMCNFTYRCFVFMSSSCLVILSTNIKSRLDHYNAVPYGTSSATNNKLQRVLYSMARAVTNSRRTKHNIKYVLASLHWLPVECRVQYKLAVTACEVLSGSDPAAVTVYSKIGSNLRLLKEHFVPQHLQSGTYDRNPSLLKFPVLLLLTVS